MAIGIITAKLQNNLRGLYLVQITRDWLFRISERLVGWCHVRILGSNVCNVFLFCQPDGSYLLIQGTLFIPDNLVDQHVYIHLDGELVRNTVQYFLLLILIVVFRRRRRWSTDRSCGHISWSRPIDLFQGSRRKEIIFPLAWRRKRINRMTRSCEEKEIFRNTVFISQYTIRYVVWLVSNNGCWCSSRPPSDRDVVALNVL